MKINPSLLLPSLLLPSLLLPTRPFYCLLLLPLDDQRIDVTQIDGTHLLSLPKADTLISYY